MNLSDNLKRIRKENNLSQEQLADKLGVSRQSVSKWESGQAYPEMDKVLQLCQLFSLNIDELLNQNIKDVNNKKQAKNTFNKFLESALDYLTRVYKMLSAMTFRQRVKCFLEMFIFGFFIVLCLMLLGSFLSYIYYGLFGFLPSSFYYGIHRILSTLYTLAISIVTIMILLHIFKIRFLDYYEKSVIEEKTNEKDDNEQVKEEKKSEKKKDNVKETKIIIRDPEHSDFRLFSGLAKIVLFFVDCFVIFCGFCFCTILIALLACLVISFLIAKSGFVFWGILLIILSLIACDIIILIKIYSFLKNRRTKEGMCALVFLLSLVCCGIGCGLFSLGMSNFKSYYNYSDKTTFSTFSETVKYDKDLVIHNFNKYNFVESDNNSIVLEVVTNYGNTAELDVYKNTIDYHVYYDADFNFFDEVRMVINDVNRNRLVDYNYTNYTIYTSKENYEQLMKNYENYYYFS